MSRAIVFLFILISTSTFSQEEREVMYRITDGAEWESCAYANKNGDTIIPFGQCIECFSDSLNYAIVITYDHKGIIAIDSYGNKLFSVFVFDNGPDYIKDGAMRIIEDGKIGYASEAGEIIIEPTYEAAWPFKDGRAEVSLKATKESDGEHYWWVGEDWFYIDKNGNRHENQEE